MCDRLRQRGHRRIPGRARERPPRLHRDESAHPGRAHRDRGDDRHRPRALAAAHRGRRDARRPRSRAGAHSPARRRPAVPDHDRGSGGRLPPRQRANIDLPRPWGSGHPARRGHGLRGRRSDAVLRSAAAQDHRSGAELLHGRRPCAAGGGGGARARRGHQPGIPRGGARRRRVSLRPRAHADGRRAPVAGLGGAAPPGSRERLTELGPEGFARALRAQQALAVTDTSMRDAHQSLFATRLRTIDMLLVAPHYARTLPELLSLEVWGGATFDVALRFLSEDPWDRLVRLREAVPNVCLQMLLRGRNLLGYEPYPDSLVRAFVAEAVDAGIDIFRIFDALNNAEPMRVAVAAALEAGAVAEGALCYTGDLSDPREERYTLDYYLRLAEQLVEAGVHVLAVKDMAGLLRAPAARTLVSRLRSEFDVPVHLHTHDTAGGQLATYLAAIEAGVHAVDGAFAPMAGMTSQPALASIAGATDHTPRATGLALDALLDLEPYWEAVRNAYAPFESGLRAPTGRLYRHEIPGGQLSNLKQQAHALGLGHRFEEVEQAYSRADALLGGIVKVTPTSKVVGDLALFAVSAGVDWTELRERPERFDLPASVLGFLRGDLGEPAGGFPEPFRSAALRARPAQRPRGAEPEHDHRLGELGPERRIALSEHLFPGPFRDQQEARRQYGDLSALPTRAFLYGLSEHDELEVDLEPGVRLVVELEAVSEPDARGMRTVLARLNGQLRPLDVRDNSIEVQSVAVERADPGEPGHIAAPMTGVVTLAVEVGATLHAGTPVAMIEAMKMESTITAPLAGKVARVVAATGARVEQGDLILVIA